LFTTTALFAATATAVAAAQTEEGIRASGRAEHQGDGKRRKGKTSVHRGTPKNGEGKTGARSSGAGGVRDQRWKARCRFLRPRTTDPARPKV
jgi:hypothetical protein